MSGSLDVLVLGAGLQGCGIALELARRGVAVTLLEQDASAFHRASLRNEGKIHLGLIYANDPSRRTTFLQLAGALRFRRIVTGWLGSDARWLVRSTPFHYLVAHDSIVEPDLLAEHYAAIDEHAARDLADDEGLDYLGDRTRPVVRPLEGDEIGKYFAGARVPAGFATAERAVDTEALARAMRRAVAASPHITFLPDHRVRTLAEFSEGFQVEGDGPTGVWRMRARQVVNATWESRAALDLQLGFAPPEHLLHRLKYRVIARLPDRLRGAPSVSMVLGRYGDIVVRPDGTAYLSWYPAGLLGWSTDLAPPASWAPACRGEVPAAEARDIAARILEGIDAWMPGIVASEPLLVDAGVIVALGRSDVDDANSALHDRTKIGVHSRGGYHSVDPGKLTTAPMFALETADRVERFIKEGVPAP